MAIFQWDDSYRVAIDTVDSQHHQLVDMLNALDEAVSTGADESALREIIRGLYDYTHYHFATEEALMQQQLHALGEHYDEHKRQHDLFAEKIRPLADLPRLDSSMLNTRLLDYLVQWLTEHILGSDKEMSHLLGQAAMPASADEAHTDWQDEGVAVQNLRAALHESEVRFRTLADCAPVLIWLSDNGGERLFFNQPWLQYTGQSLKALQAGGWREAIHEEDRDGYLASLSTAGQEAGATTREFRLRGEDGHYRWFLETTAQRPAVSGKRIGLVGSCVDITTRKAAERVLVEARERLEQEVAMRTAELREANRRLQEDKAKQQALIAKLGEAHEQLLQSEKMASIGQLAAGVAHEINNPVGYVKSNLNTLDGYIGNLLQLIDGYEKKASALVAGGEDFSDIAALRTQLDFDFLRQDVVTLLAESQEGVTRVKQIVQDLREFSHTDQAEWKLADINKGLATTLNIAANEIKYRADVVRDFAPLPLIKCMPQQLNQVFMNILVNAAQAIEGKRGTITVRTRVQEKGVLIEITDTGKGIAPEIVSRIFDPFFTTKAVGKGTGLGLSIAYGIVRKHGGHIDVQSDSGQGTTMRITLPQEPPAV